MKRSREELSTSLTRIEERVRDLLKSLDTPSLSTSTPLVLPADLDHFSVWHSHCLTHRRARNAQIERVHAAADAHVAGLDELRYEREALRGEIAALTGRAPDGPYSLGDLSSSIISTRALKAEEAELKGTLKEAKVREEEIARETRERFTALSRLSVASSSLLSLLSSSFPPLPPSFDALSSSLTLQRKSQEELPRPLLHLYLLLTLSAPEGITASLSLSPPSVLASFPGLSFSVRALGLTLAVDAHPALTRLVKGDDGSAPPEPGVTLGAMRAPRWLQRLGGRDPLPPPDVHARWRGEGEEEADAAEAMTGQELVAEIARRIKAA